MEGHELQRQREDIGITREQFAAVLRTSWYEATAQQVTDWEEGREAIPGWIEIVLHLLRVNGDLVREIKIRESQMTDLRFQLRALVKHIDSALLS